MVAGQGLYKIKPVNILAGSGGGAHEPLPFSEKLLVEVDGLWGRESEDLGG